MKKNRTNIKRYVVELFKYGRLKIAIAFMLMLGVAACNLYQPQLIKKIIDAAIPQKNTKLLIYIVGAYFIIALVSYILDILLQYFYSVIKRSISLKYKNRLLNHLTKMHGKFILEKKTGELLKILDDDVFNIENLGVETVFTLISQIITATFSFFLLVSMQSAILGIVVFIEIIEIFIQLKYTKKIASQTADIRDLAGNTTSILEEFVSNIMNIIITKCKSAFWNKLILFERSFRKKCIRLDMEIEISSVLSNFFHILIVLSIYLIGGYWTIKGRMSLGALVIYIEYVNMLTGPIYNIIKLNSRIQQTAVSINRIYGILDEKPQIQQNNDGFIPDEFRGNIHFDQVSFSYDKNKKVLLEVDFNFEPGTIVGIVGNTGCGKSTIIKLLYRLWDIDEGLIVIDEIPIREYNLYYLRKQISIITQDVLIFNDTIWNNIKFRTKMNDDKIRDICKDIGIEEFVSKFENGYKTVVGEKGAKLSGGQRQKIAIARALVADTKIIIMDEATSALDNISQNNVMVKMQSYIKNKTVIIIAHRLSVVKEAKNIYVLKNGECVGQGSHEILLNECNDYKELINAESN